MNFMLRFRIFAANADPSLKIFIEVLHDVFSLLWMYGHMKNVLTNSMAQRLYLLMKRDRQIVKFWNI